MRPFAWLPLLALLLWLPAKGSAQDTRYIARNEGIVFAPALTARTRGNPFSRPTRDTPRGVIDLTGVPIAPGLTVPPSAPRGFDFLFLEAIRGVAPGGWTPASRTGTGRYGLYTSASLFTTVLDPGDILELSGIGTWVGPVVGDGGTVVLDGLKGVPMEVKHSLRSGDIRGDRILEVGPKLTLFNFGRVEVAELVSYEEITLDSSIQQVGRSLDWAAPTVFGPEVFFLAGVSALDNDYAIHEALGSFSGAPIQQGISDVAFTTDTFLANKLQDYLDERVDRRVDENLRGEPSDALWNIFVRGVGSRSDRGDQLWVNYGAIAGVDRRLGERSLVGAFAGYRRTSASELDAAGSDFRSNDPSVGFYGSTGCGCGFELAGAAWYTYRDYTGLRRVSVPGFATSASFDTDAHQLTTFGRASWAWRPVAESALVVAPRFAVQYSRLAVGGYDESGADALDLAVGSSVPESLRTALGFRVASPFALGAVRVRPELRGDWYHELFDGAWVPVSVESPFFNDFNVGTEVPERNVGKLGVGVTATFADCDCLEVGLGFDTIVSGEGLDAFDTTLNVGVRF